MFKYGGLQIFEDWLMVDIKEDWSRVRSPARARRRRWKHKQNIDIVHVPKPEAIRMGNKVYMHPEMAAELRRQVASTTPPKGETE